MNKTIPQNFFDSAKKYSDRPALLYKKEGVYFPISYKEFSEKVISLACFLQNFGFKKGEMAAILSENRPEWVVADLAIMEVGGIVAPLHTTFNSKAICDVLNHCQARLLFVSNSDLLNKVLLKINNLKYLEKIIFFEKLTQDQLEALKGKILGWQEIFVSSQGKNNLQKIPLDENDCCSVIYTSGTTGEPKGVMLSHQNFLSNAEAILKIIPVKKHDVFLSFLPLSHVLERLAGYYCPLICGAKIAYAENSKQLPQNLKEVRPTILISVPRVFEKFHDAIWDKINASWPLIKNIFKWALRQKKGTLTYAVGNILIFKKIRGQLGGRLRLAISGGASLNKNMGGFFQKIGLPIIEGYGLTETSPIITVNRQSDFKFGTVGKPVQGVDIKIGPNKEILVKGPNVFKGYLKNEKQTAIAFDKDGWFCTGDLGFIDKEGFLTIIGRQKEMLATSGGKNIFPEPIENILNNDRFISQSAIIGDKRKFVSALIVPDWQEVEIYLKKNSIPLKSHEKLINDSIILSIFQQRIDEKINPLLQEFEKIRKFRLLCQEFSQEQDELTPTLKLRRHIIDVHYKKLISLMYND